MASHSTKKLIQSNSKTIRSTIKIIISSNILYLLVLIYNSYPNNISHKFKFYVLKTIPEVLIFLYLYKISRPKYAIEDGKRKFISPGINLNGRGITGIIWDALYLTIIIKDLSLISNWFYYLYFVIFVCIWYEFYHTFGKMLRKKK